MRERAPVPLIRPLLHGLATPACGQPHPPVHDVSTTGFTAGCIPEINQVLFGGPDPNPACAAVDPASGLPAVFLRDGLFPGRTISVDTRSRGTHLFECLIHPWMQATVTVE